MQKNLFMKKLLFCVAFFLFFFLLFLLFLLLLRYSNCECTDCRMVEERRKLNNLLSSRRLDPNHTASRPSNGKKIRDPKCARCSAHGNKQPLRGHKKAQCPYIDCPCHLVGLRIVSLSFFFFTFIYLSYL